MTPTKQNEALALLAGWKYEYIGGNGVDDYVWVCPNTNTAYMACYASHMLPKYTEDPRLLAELESKLSVPQRATYAQFICDHAGITIDSEDPTVVSLPIVYYLAACIPIEIRIQAILTAAKLWTE